MKTWPAFGLSAIKALIHLHSIHYHLRTSMSVALSVWNIFRKCANNDVDPNLNLFLHGSFSKIAIFFFSNCKGTPQKKMSSLNWRLLKCFL